MKSVMMTLIYLEKSKIITKKALENYYKREYNQNKDSINDDLESLFTDLRLGKEPDEAVQTHFLPMLKEKEQELDHWNHCLKSLFGDLRIGQEPDSEPNFYQGKGRRKTFTIKYDNSEIVSQNIDNSFENSSENFKENLSEKSQNISKCCFLL